MWRVQLAYSAFPEGCILITDGEKLRIRVWARTDISL